MNCASCLKEIIIGQQAVLVSYGFIAKGKGRFYCKEGVDYFHKECDKAFRST